MPRRWEPTGKTLSSRGSRVTLNGGPPHLMRVPLRSLRDQRKTLLTGASVLRYFFAAIP
jgi:hypothetical protein